ncbi:hypothetical protein NQZ68_025981 [Dissostichus eleginoides]|nr:hypothetical protein NQZ68_025981 [Dissostichus eleginoides]
MIDRGVLLEVAALPFIPSRWTVSTESRSFSTDSGTTLTIHPQIPPPFVAGLLLFRLT